MHSRTMNRFVRWSLFALTLFGISSEAYAGGNRRLPPSKLQGVRPMGMGGAFTAVADDQNALYYNPAGLAKRTDWNAELLDPLVGWNNYVQENIDSFKKLTELANSGSSDVEKFVQDLDPVLTGISGENHYLRFGWNPYFVMKNFGFGLFINDEAQVTPHKNALPTVVDLSNFFDVDLRFGYGRLAMGDKLAWGLTLGPRIRNSITLDEFGIFKLYDISSSQTSQKKLIEESVRLGWTIPIDAGILFTPVKTLEPTFGFAVQNIGDARFSKIKTKANNGTPDPLPMSVNFGFSLKKELGISVLKPAVEMRDVNLPIPASQKMALGMDWGIYRKYISAAAQLGLSEGNLSWGTEFKLLVLNIRYSSYVTNRGYFESFTKERRHLVGLKILL